MLATPYLKNDRKKRLSETRQPLDFKLAVSTKKNSSTHNRSSSMNRDKKLRLNTDYGEYEGAFSTSVANYGKFTKKIAIGVGKRRDTYEF